MIPKQPPEKYTITAKVTFEIKIDIEAEADSYDDAVEMFKELANFKLDGVLVNGDKYIFNEKSRHVKSISKR